MTEPGTLLAWRSQLPRPAVSPALLPPASPHLKGHTQGASSCPGDRHPPSWALPYFVLVRDITVTLNAVTPSENVCRHCLPKRQPSDSPTGDRRFSFPLFNLSSFIVVRSATHEVPTSASVHGTPLQGWTRPPELSTFRTRNSVPRKLDFPEQQTRNLSPRPRERGRPHPTWHTGH